MDPSNTTTDNRGSVWNRWEPHIHTPGTVLNDQFDGDDPWDAFLKALETSDPPIRALGITDYLSIDRYEDALRYKANNRIPNVGILFPNVEMRFGIETRKGSPINVHLLFSPEDPVHIDEIRRFLRKLEFSFRNESYGCSREDLIRLGKAYDPAAQDDLAALSAGTNQFKVNFDQLQDLWKNSEWIRRNCLVAVASGEADGTSGLRDPTGSFAALRNNIEAFAHIIFASNPKQIEFWLGRGKAPVDELESKWNGVKPCLHGSDAHAPQTTGSPEGDRFCWLKGDLTFETLRQACIEPESRAYIGSHPPRGALPGQTMSKIRITNASWMKPPEISLNRGLIAIIGARGSGKTALADVIAAGGSAAGKTLSPSSFVLRAKEHLQESRAELVWESGEMTGNDLRNAGLESEFDVPAIQYLSQQFVDELCSSEGLAESLVGEIERVIFNAHSEDQLCGAANFKELYDLKSAPSREKRGRFEDELEEASNELAEERLLKQGLGALQKQRDELVKQRAQDIKDKASLVPKGHDERVKRHEGVSAALELRKRDYTTLQTRLRALKALKEDVADIRSRRAPNWLSRLKQERGDAGLDEKEWDAFGLNFTGNVDLILEDHNKAVERQSQTIAGPQRAEPSPAQTGNLTLSLIPPEANLSLLSVSLLQREVARLTALIGVDAQNAKRFAALGDKISTATQTLANLEKQILHSLKADDRIKLLLKRRSDAYAGVFSAVTDLEKELRAIYEPLALRLGGSKGPLGSLSFSIKRNVAIESWASIGEQLLDLRKNGPFKGCGALEAAARKSLLLAWESGTGEDVSTAMSEFIKENEDSLRAHKPEGIDNRIWVSQVAKWLHSTDHVSVAYGLQYDGVDVKRLSPGTRGIVLLLLYLAVDEKDERPLIIDQPEENLDPQSVFDELVPRFREARTRRQIIIVTHNANLVVNTDADQVIVANASPHDSGSLPEINYEIGGLENPHIRKRVCEILEGGERAFRARARRLRVALDWHTSISSI